MLTYLPPSQITLTPIKFGYVKPDRDFFGDFIVEDEEDVVGSHQFQSELSSVWDFSCNYDSVNFLTEPRERFSEGMEYSSLAVFSQNAPELLSGAPDPCFNYWATFPKQAFLGEDGCELEGNILPLKNNFSETENITCSPCYRQYNRFNFGESGYDNYKPSFLFTTNYLTVEEDDDKFKFKIPDYSPDIDLNNMDFSCFGAIAGDCPTNSDKIIFDGSVTWLSGDECDGIWVDRTYGVSGTCLSSIPELESVLYKDITPSTKLLLSGQEYLYQRPDIDTQIDVLQERCDDGTTELSGRFIFMADQGLVNDNQLSAAQLVYDSGDIQGVFFGGDNNYPDGSYAEVNDNWDVFDPLIEAEIAFPAMGNHDLDLHTLGQPQTELFTYLPNNKRYYNVLFEDASLELFVLNSGLDTGGDLQEPDGNTIGSVQYNWFIEQLEKSTAKYRVVMFHHPYASLIANEAKIVAQMDWQFDQLPVDLILNGHTHTNQHLRHYTLDIVDCSATVRSARTIDEEGDVNGSSSHGVEHVWTDSGFGEDDSIPAVVYIDVTPCGLGVSFVSTLTKEPYYTFQIDNKRNEDIINQECDQENVQGIIFQSEGLDGETLLDASGNENNATIIF